MKQAPGYYFPFRIIVTYHYAFAEEILSAFLNCERNGRISPRDFPLGCNARIQIALVSIYVLNLDPGIQDIDFIIWIPLLKWDIKQYLLARYIFIIFYFYSSRSDLNTFI